MKKFILIILTILVISSCQKQPERSDESPIFISGNFFEDFNDEQMIKTLSGKIIAGDTIAYAALKEIYFNSGHSKEFLYYSITMANNFQYYDAYFTTYIILRTDIIDSTNVASNKIANDYLLKAFELGHKDANYEMKDRFPESNNLESGNNLLNHTNK